MADVARLAGVSHQTVSRVVNGHDNVRPETRDKVRAAMDEVGYRPNSAARMLASRRSQVIGVLSASMARGPALVLRGVEAAARSARYVTTVASLDEVTPAQVASAIGVFREVGVDGMVAIVPHEAATDSLRAVRDDLPVVTVDGHRSLAAVPVVSTDQHEAGRIAVEHLLSLGHSTVHHVAGPSAWQAAREREAGWRRALETAGATIPAPRHGDWSAEDGFAIGTELARDREVTAILAANDQMALGVLRALAEGGRQVPAQVSVVGMDDEPESAHFLPPLTTVAMAHREVGERAFEVLLRLVQDEEVPRQSLLEPELVIRTSTGPSTLDLRT